MPASAIVASVTAAGNVEYVLASDRSKKAGGIVAVLPSTTKAGGVLAVPITARVVTMTTGGVEALTLANGLPGQRITIILGTDGGDGTLTPATSTGWATCVFADAKDTLTLEYVDDTVGWIVIGYSGTAAPPVLT